MRRFALTSKDNNGPKQLLDVAQQLRAKARELQDHLSGSLLRTAEMHAQDHVDSKLFSLLSSPKRYHFDHDHALEVEARLRSLLQLPEGGSHPRITALHASIQASIRNTEKLPTPKKQEEVAFNCLVRILHVYESEQAFADACASELPATEPDIQHNEIGVRIILTDAARRNRVEYAPQSSVEDTAWHRPVLTLSLLNLLVELLHSSCTSTCIALPSPIFA